MHQAKHISKIGLGCVTFGREIDQAQAFAMMDFALKRGVTFFDTASSYQEGASESIVGAWLSSRQLESGNVLVATKILPPYNSQSIVRSVDQSLKRLGVDVIDVLYLHRWDDSIRNDEGLLALDKIVKQGKAQKLGASNFTGLQLEETVERQVLIGAAPFQVTQNNHNLAVSDVTLDLKKVCLKKQLDLVTYSPLGAGFLTGKYNNGMISGTRFEIIPGHQNIYFNEQSFIKLERLKELSLATGYSMVHLALAWVLSQKEIKSVLIGGRNTDQLEQAFMAQTFSDQGILAALDY